MPSGLLSRPCGPSTRWPTTGRWRWSAAIGARDVETLSKGGPRANVEAILRRFTVISRAAGYEPDIAIYSAHGEADAAAGTSEAVYYAAALSWYRQTQLMAAQALGRPDYIAPVLLTYPLQQSGGGVPAAGANDRAIKEAIRRVARDLPGAVDLGGAYQWPAESDRTHPAVASYVKRGEAVGRAIRQVFEDGRSWGQALHIVDVTLSGSTFVATFDREIVRDDSLGVGQNLNTANAEDGFEWSDDGSQIAITAVAYAGRRATGTLASEPVGALAAQVLRIAVQTTTATLVAGAANLSGSVVRAAGAGWPSIHDPAYVNHTWAAPQSFKSVRAG